MKNKNHFDRLPDSVICFSIMGFLTPRDRITAANISKNFKKNAHTDAYPQAEYWLSLGGKSYNDFKERAENINKKNPYLMNALLDNRLFPKNGISHLESAETISQSISKDQHEYLSGKGSTFLF